MEDFEFNFKEKDYLIFIQLIEKKSTIGIIVLNKTGLIELSDFEKEKYLKNIFGLDYETIGKLEEKVNPKALVKIVNDINKSVYFYCDTEMRKNLLEQNLKNMNYVIEIKWKIEL